MSDPSRAPSRAPLTPRDVLRALGPGILFAGAAVGVSHLVQSTRAGAEYGFAFVAVVIGANVLKYPAFRFGPEYAAATGTSLLEGYRRQGRWALWLYGLVTLITMFGVQAAVTLVTAGLAIHLFGLSMGPLAVAVLLTLGCVVLLGVGRYRWLERVGLVVVATLTLTTLAATAIALRVVDWGSAHFTPSQAVLEQPGTWIFLAALIGWMPSAVDVSVWQSLWTLEQAKAAREQGAAPSSRQLALLDFHVGYVGTTFLAVCFLVLGAAVMQGQTFEASPHGFAAQLVNLYAQTLGDWSKPLLALCAFMVMFSTTLTVVDGFPRALSALGQRLRRSEREHPPMEQAAADKTYWWALVLLAVGALTLLGRFANSMPTMISIATTASFLTAPVLSWLNHRAMHGDEVGPRDRPRPWLTVFSGVTIVAQLAFATFYLWLRLSSP
jgi:Mn2+/Fe2+ NRAMP family transporter